MKSVAAEVIQEGLSDQKMTEVSTPSPFVSVVSCPVQSLWWLAEESHIMTKRNTSPALLWHHILSQNEQIEGWWTQQPTVLTFIFAKAAKTSQGTVFSEDFLSEVVFIV